MKRCFISILTLLISSHLSAADSAATRGKIEQALGGSIRDAAEVARAVEQTPWKSRLWTPSQVSEGVVAVAR